MSSESPKVFLNAPLSSAAERLLNDEILRHLRAHGFTSIYAPHVALPVGTDLSPVELKNANLRAVEDCDVVVSVLDKPGLGVVMELTWALAMGKPIAAFRSSPHDYLGKMLEGVWQDLPKQQRACCLDDIATCVANALRRESVTQ